MDLFDGTEEERFDGDVLPISMDALALIPANPGSPHGSSLTWLPALFERNKPGGKVAVSAA